MANTNIELVGLDFDTIKSNLKTYMRTNTKFKDMDFEGSNISVLLDVLAYNTYLNSYYTNMVASEMFLDTAQLRDSIVSHAKELNYTPRSSVSSQASVTIQVTPSTSVDTVVIPQYTSFTTRIGTDTYTFSTDETIIASTTDGTVYTATTPIYEGVIVDETFVFSGEVDQRFVLSNDSIDINNISVTVYEDNADTILTYQQAHTLIGMSSTTQRYFVQAAENGQYEIVFGDGVFGRQPKVGATIVVTYRATSGEDANGATSFISDGSIDGHSNIVVVTNSIASGGAVPENVESIRFNAPRSFITQDRAVTASDYEVLLKARFPDIQAISVYGGEEHNPPQYGKVFISADVYGADGASKASQDLYLEYIKDKTPLTIVPEFIDPEFLHVEIETTVDYDVSVTKKTSNDIKTAVYAAIDGFANDYLNDFNTTLYLSSLVSAIDNADTSIIGNETTITAIKEWHPTFEEESGTYELGVPLARETGKLLTTDESHYGHTITSTKFKVGTQICIMMDDGLGTMYLAAAIGEKYEIVKSIGTVDYDIGRIVIDSIKADEVVEGTYVKVFMQTLSKNISARKNILLTVSLDDVSVTVRGVRAS